MKKLLLFSMIILLLSGCSVVHIDKMSIEDTIDSVLKNENDLKTVSLSGYSYFLPQGVSLKNNIKGNSILYFDHNKMFLYVDVVSYYNKVKSDYSINSDIFYSKDLKYNNKFGYLNIIEVEDDYFVEYMYNYSKIECYVAKKDLNKALTIMSYILNSVKFNDVIIDSLIGPDAYNSSEEQFNIFKPNNNVNTYLDYVEKYDKDRTNSKDEDVLELDTIE